MTVSNPGLDPYYQIRVAQIAQDIATGGPDGVQSVVLLGDSITEANPAKTLSGKRVYNMGINGDQADASDRGLLRRLYQVAQVRPSYLFLMIGINDLASGKHPALLLKQHEQVIEALHAVSPETIVHVQLILPVRDELAYLTPLVQSVNAELQRQPTEPAILDLWPVMADANGELKLEFTNDGVHLLPAAYELWNQILEKIIQQS